MFENAGDKIKTTSVILFALGIIGSVIWAINLFSDYATSDYALPVLVVGVIICWISSLGMYGFGQIVDDVHAMRLTQTSKPAHTIDPFEKDAINPASKPTVGTGVEWECKKCKSSNPGNLLYCKGCGTYK